MQGLGLGSSTLWEGFSAELLLAWIRSSSGFSLAAWAHYCAWFEKAAAALRHREQEWITAVVAAWQAKPAPGEIRKIVSRYLVDRFGEPRDESPVWEHCSAAARETIRHWLLFENLEKFFDFIADYAQSSGGEMRLQWRYRKAFWLALYRTGAVSDLRVAAGRGFLQAMGLPKLQDCFGTKLAKLDDSDERRCALILRLNDLTIVDFTHNAKCRIWKTSPRQEQWFSRAKLSRSEFQDGSDLKIKARYSESGIAHFSSETYAWQDAVAEFLHSYSAVRVSRNQFEVRNS